MKIEFRRTENSGLKLVKLYAGGVFVCQIGEQSVGHTDWESASEAGRACREELERWLDEKPPKPEQFYPGDFRDDARLTDVIWEVEKRTREIVAWEQEHGDE